MVKTCADCKHYSPSRYPINNPDAWRKGSCMIDLPPMLEALFKDYLPDGFHRDTFTTFDSRCDLGQPKGNENEQTTS